MAMVVISPKFVDCLQLPGIEADHGRVVNICLSRLA